MLENIKKLTPVYEVHLQHLRGMSRPLSDWLLDTILQPLNKTFIIYT